LAARRGDALLDSWIFAGGNLVDSVWSAGRQVVNAGRHVAREHVTTRYRATLQQLLSTQ
jgi:hypothetical protein